MSRFCHDPETFFVFKVTVLLIAKSLQNIIRTGTQMSKILLIIIKMYHKNNLLYFLKFAMSLLDEPIAI